MCLIQEKIDWNLHGTKAKAFNMVEQNSLPYKIERWAFGALT